jgi:peptide/nickel transport system permease protein
MGTSDARIIIRHILPNTLAPIIVLATVGMAAAIIAEAALSFLGLGVQPPTPSWGTMLNEGRGFLRTAPHISTLPGLAIMLTVLGFNFLGDGLRDAFDPRL